MRAAWLSTTRSSISIRHVPIMVCPHRDSAAFYAGRATSPDVLIGALVACRSDTYALQRCHETQRGDCLISGLIRIGFGQNVFVLFQIIF